MYSGKSTTLMRELTTYADLGLKVIYINHSDDNRESYGDSNFSTHNSQYTHISPKIRAVKTSSLGSVCDLVSEYQVIGIDETQFFTDLKEMVSNWVTQKHKMVLCAGLDGDAFRNPFGQTLELIPLANYVTKLNAKCHQHLNDRTGFAGIVDAPFTVRLSKSKEQKLVGGADLYVPACRQHYDEYQNNLK